MNHSVIIPEFIPHEKIRSFIPEVVKIQNGDNVKWIFGFKPSTNIDLKCAIHVGDVIFGYWNSPSRVQITAMGKNVNFCSRLEGFANKNQIIISEEVNKLVMGKFDTNKLYIPKSERMKSFKHIDHVYEIIRPKF